MLPDAFSEIMLQNYSVLITSEIVGWYGWDLYNEPINSDLGRKSLTLVRRVFKWSREIDPSQPVIIAIWDNNLDLNN